MKYTAVIWDFNGTIADDIDLGIGAVNKMLAERGLPILSTREEYRAKLRFPIKDYYADLGFDFSKEPYEKLAHEWIALYNAGEKDVRACAGAPEAIRRISESGLEQIILSASELSMMENTLCRLGLYDCFNRIIGQDNIYASGKLGTARALADELSGNYVMIGDTVHDFEAARELGADCILYSGGHAPYEKLAELGVPIVGDLREAADIILGD